MEVEVWEFLNTDDYEIESKKLVSRFISTIVQPDDILGFIYSFFTDWENQNIKKNILKQFDSDFQQSDSNFSFYNPRDPKLFNEAKNEIILTDKEIQYINQSYFIKRLEQNYNNFFSDLDSFHRHFRREKDFSLFQTYEMLLIYINERKSIFNNSGNIKNSLELNMIFFKDAVLNNNISLRQDLNDKILILDIPQQASIQNVFLPEKSRNTTLYELLNSRKDFEKYNHYESKLIEHQYLSRDGRQWLKKAVDLIKFYSFCERESLFNDDFEKNSHGVKLMRQLYNFHTEKSMDVPTKRKQKSHFADLSFLKF